MITASCARGQEAAPPLDEALAFDLRLRARLVRRDDRAGLASLAAFESGLRARVRVVVARPSGNALDLEVSGRLRLAQRPGIAVVRCGDRLRWQPPPELSATLDEDDRDVTGRLDGQVGVVLRSQRDQSEWALTVTSRTHMRAAGDHAAPVSPRVEGGVRIDPETAGDAPLPPGRYDVLVTPSIAGFAAETAARVNGAPFTLTVTPDRRVAPSHRVRASPRRDRLAARIARAAHPRGSSAWSGGRKA